MGWRDSLRTAWQDDWQTETGKPSEETEGQGETSEEIEAEKAEIGNTEQEVVEKPKIQLGKQLARIPFAYVGGFGANIKNDDRAFAMQGQLFCCENYIFYSKKNNAFFIPTDQITGFQVGGNSQVNSRITVTRMATLGIFSLAAPKRTTTKDTTITVSIRDGRQVLFHSTLYTEFEVHKKLVNAISYYSSLQATQASQQTAIQQVSDPANEIAKYARLRDDKVITEEEFQAKKKQLLGL